MTDPDRSLELLRCVAHVAGILRENETVVRENVALKRELVQLLSERRYRTALTREEFDRLLAEIFSLLDASLLDERVLVERIANCTLLAALDSDGFDLCLAMLNDIGEALIATGPAEHPGEGGGDDNPEDAIEHALHGAPNVHADTALPEAELLAPRLFNIPTDKERSPSRFVVGDREYDASVPFTQQLLRFEELGRLHMDGDTNFLGAAQAPPKPAAADGYPVEAELVDFMQQVASGTGMGYPPSRVANDAAPNPWADAIRAEIDPPGFTDGVAEGRAPGLNGAHQKWDEQAPPRLMTATCQTGAVTNRGARDSVQLHGYQHGEFAPGGLYHAPLPGFNGTTSGIAAKLHHNLPVQHKESVWTFDGTFPPKLLMAKYGEPLILRHYNFLPIRPDRNRGFGMHTITTHEHNGTHNGVSDGFAQAFFFPGEYYDYLYGMTLAGHTTHNVEAAHPKAAAPADDWQRDSEGAPLLDAHDRPIPEPNQRIAGDWKETMSTHWFHDHMLDYTAQNVYKGNAAMMNYYSALDRGNEAIDDGVNLRLPSGTALTWGNRDYDVNLAVMDKAWDSEGQLWFNPFNTNGFLGDRMLVNWVLEPYFEVRARRYRFRILNASVSRFVKLALVRKFNNATDGALAGPAGSNTSYSRVPFWLVANCGNLMMHAVHFDGTNGTTSATLPVQAIAERLDIVVDFGDFADGDRLYLVNVLEHLNGKRPNKEVPLGEVLSGAYIGDPCVMAFMEFRVRAYAGEDLSVHPSQYEVGRRSLIPIEPLNEAELRTAVQRNFNFVNKSGTTDEWAIETDGGPDYQMDPRRLSAAPTSGQLELWTLRNGAPTWAHNVHIHYTEGKILLRDDQLPPIWEQFARKDVYRVGGGVDSSESLVVALRFSDTSADSYMMHCHNTQHEDHAMLLRFDVAAENCVRTLACPLPTWEGVRFMETKTLPTFRTGMLQDNLFFVSPERLLRRLRQIDTVVPDAETGSYFVNGVGKALQLAESE